MRKIFLYAPIILVALFFLFMNKDATELHWKNVIEKILSLGLLILVIYLIEKFYEMIRKK